MARTQVSAAHALKAFRNAPLVMTARPGKVRYVKDGVEKERDGYVTKEVSATEEHVISAAQYDDRMVVVTIDGKRHEQKGRFATDGKADKADEKGAK